MKHLPTGRWLGPVALTIALGCAAVAAAEPPPSIGTTIREIEQKRPAVPPKSDPSLQVDSTRHALAASAGATFRVSSVRISGATAFSDLELLPLVAGIAGRDVSLADLEAAAARITQFYRANGFPVARAYVPAQKIDAGSVEIAVLEGRYGKLDVRNDSRLSDSIIRDTLRAPAADHVIETAPLDRDLLLLKDLAGASVTATLTPGEAVGTSNLVVDLASTSMLSGTLEADNFGNKYTGELRYGGSVAAANLAGRGDVLTVRGLISEESGLWYGRAAYQIPIAGNGLLAGGAVSHTYYSLGEKFDALNADGDANIYTLFLRYPVLRSTRANLDVQTAFNYYDLEDDVGAANTVDPRWLRSATLSVSGNVRDDWFGGAINAATLSFGNGTVQLRDDVAETIDRATAQTKGNFDTILYSLLRLQNVTDSLQLYLAVQGQYASKNLDPSQKFVLGGPNAVRAYAQGSGVGDDGVLGTAELRYTLAPRGWLTRPQVFAFFDGGSIHVNADPYLPTENHVDLYGAGVGVNLDTVFGLSVRGSVAWRVGSDPAVDSSDSSSRGWLQIVKTL